MLLSRPIRLANNSARAPASPLSTLSSPDIRSDARSGDFTPLDSATSWTFPLTEQETCHYYDGLPSRPILIARSSVTPWKLPSGPEAYPELKQLCLIGNHLISAVWDHDVAPAVHAYLANQKVPWTSIDLVRIGTASQCSSPVVLWIGVRPKSLSGKDGHAVVAELQRCLQARGLGDVEVEIPLSSEAAVNFVELLSASLGIPIAAKLTPYAEGMGGIFVAKKGDASKTLYLLTAHHVVTPPPVDDRKKHEHKNPSQPRHDVILFSDATYQKLLMSIMTEIGNKGIIARVQEGRLTRATGKVGPRYDKERADAQGELDKANAAVIELHSLYQEVESQWAAPVNRVLGHVVLSPLIGLGLGPGGYTRDFAIIEIDPSKINASNFSGNIIDLGAEIDAPTITAMLHPDQCNPDGFTYPNDHLLPLHGTIPETEMRNPTLLDQNDEPCLLVLKRGNTTKLTIGHANTIDSFVRIYFDDDDDDDREPETSMKWAILPHDNRSGPLSTKGDSSSIIVDGLGRVGGLLTGGGSATESSDITYAMPIHFLLAEMEANGFRAHLNPQLA